MKVCVLLNVLDPYKGGNHLPLFEAASDTEFTILCNRSKCYAADLPSNVTVIEVPGRIGPYYYGIADFLFARSVLKRYVPHSPFWQQFQCIHINQTMGPALKKLKRTGVPLLFLIHHPVTADRSIAMAESGWLSALRWWLKYALLIWWQRKLCRVAHHVATVSQTMRERIASDYHVPSEKISVIPNGVDGEAFTPVTDAQCQYDVIALGSFVHPRKGFPYLLQAYKELAHLGFKIADVGRRSEKQLQQLKAIDGVTVHSMVDVYTLRDLVRHSRVLISVSLFEGFGLSLIEALASGRPAVAFSVGAVEEVLGGIDEDFLVPPRDTVALVEKVEKYLGLSGEERDSRGVTYRETVLERYSLEKSAQALQDLYTTLITG